MPRGRRRRRRARRSFAASRSSSGWWTTGWPRPAQLKELELKKGNSKALATDACDEYREAFEAYRALCLDSEQARNHALLRVLLDLYGRRYDVAKRARSALDFEDLELLARDLLAGDEALREQYSSRYEHVMVDEFQDVNPLQSELIGLIARDNLFRVGDENQSIYGFRHADVNVFREHRQAAAEREEALSVTVNFRSRGELIDAVAMTFERLWDEDYEPLREAPGAREPAVSAPVVDLLVTDLHKGRWDAALPPEDGALGAGMAGVTPWRALEARMLARRIDELTREGPYEYRDVVVLLRATTSMSVYERALVERGIPTHVVGGRGYWSQQQVSDLRHWLAALANPLDELALYSVLASPLAGVSLDSVTLLALHARKSGRDPMWALREAIGNAEDGLAMALPSDDLARARTFLERFDSERAEAPRVALETLIDRAVTRTGYDRHLLALPAGERRMANVRKLMRMAREYEADEGRDLRGFIDAIAERDVLQEREGEAPLEAETLDAVRLMTIHRAKGLEFPVVAVGDLGKVGREDDGRLRISADGTTGMRLAGIGGGAVNSRQLDRIKAEQKTESEEEERRVFYVAMTRAERHLILSGATDLEKLNEPDELCEPMRWIWRGVCAGLPSEGAEGLHVDRRDGREVSVAWRRLTPDTLPELLEPADLAPAEDGTSGAADGGQQAELELAAVPAPRALPVSRLSYSGLEAYRRCSYRFYLERSLGLRGVAPPAREDRPAAAPGLSALLRGSLVHLLLEDLDFERPRVPGAEEVAALIERHGVPVREEDVADLRAMVERFAESDLRARIAAARRVRTELPFAFTLEPPGAGGRRLVVNGVVDVYATEPDGVLVVDHKSDALDGRDPEELVRPPTPPRGSCTGSPRFGRAHPAWWWPTASWSALTSRPSWNTRRRTPRTSRRSSSRWRAGWSRRASSRPTTPTASCAPTAPAARRSAAGDPIGLWQSRPLPVDRRILGFPSGAGPIFRLVQHANRRGVRADASLLHRAAGSDQGRGRERRSRSTQAAPRRGGPRMGRRDPRRRAGGALRQGRRRARRRRPLDARRLARVARGRPPDRQQGVPPGRVRAPRPAPSRGPAHRRRLQGRRCLRGRGERGAGARHRAALAVARAVAAAGRRGPRSVLLGSTRLRQLTAVRSSRWRSAHAPATLSRTPYPRDRGPRPSPGSPTATPSGCPASAGCG